MDRCTLCGGRLNADRICTECGMDNKKDDSQYRLNENLPVEQPGAIPRDTGQRGPGGQTGAGPRPGSPGRGGYGYGSFPKAGSRGSTPGQNSGLAGKIVFVVVLVTVILSAVLGFLQEEKQAVTETSSEDWEIPDWEALSEQREFTITSETGEVSARISLLEDQIYSYGGEGYLSSMQENWEDEEYRTYLYAFEAYIAAEDMWDIYVDPAWMEGTEEYRDIETSETAVMDVDGRTVYWAGLDYVYDDGNSVSKQRKLCGWTQAEDSLFVIQLDDSCGGENREATASEENLREAFRRVEFL